MITHIDEKKKVLNECLDIINLNKRLCYDIRYSNNACEFFVNQNYEDCIYYNIYKKLCLKLYSNLEDKYCFINMIGSFGYEVVTHAGKISIMSYKELVDYIKSLS